MNEPIARLDFIGPRRGHCLVVLTEARNYEPKGMKAPARERLKGLEVRIGRGRFRELDFFKSPIRLSPKRHNLAIKPIGVSLITPVQSGGEMAGPMPKSEVRAFATHIPMQRLRKQTLACETRRFFFCSRHAKREHTRCEWHS